MVEEFRSHRNLSAVFLHCHFPASSYAPSAMEVSPSAISNRRFSALPPRCDRKSFDPNMEVIKQRLLRKGVFPTPKFLHALRKKEIQKHIRRTNKLVRQSETLNLSDTQCKPSEEDSLFRNAAAEYRAVMAEFDGKREQRGTLSRRPWKRETGVDLVRSERESEGFAGGMMKGEHLEELRMVLAERNGEALRWFLDDDDVEKVEAVGEESAVRRIRSIERMRDDEKIRLLTLRLSSSNLNIQDWKFSRLMRHSGLLFSEMCMIDIIKELGVLGNWRQALSVVQWVYIQQEYKKCKSRFVYTKLLSILGKERRPSEALKIFNEMREDGQIYPDMAAYHSIAVTLGQAGLLEELIHVIECMRLKPHKKLKNVNLKNWNPCLDPDIIIYNAVLNACIPSCQWKGVSWVLHQMRLSGLSPTETTYGLAMEVMLKARKYDLVHKYFEKMQRGGLVPRAITYKVLVRTFWGEGKVDEAVAAVRDMERRGVVGTPGVYYELACCLCNNGQWLDANLEVEKLRRLPHTKPLEVTFTGMILASLNGGYTDDCISIYEYMKDYCTPNIGTINAMLKVYAYRDMFAKAKQLFESVKEKFSGFNTSAEVRTLKPDAYTYTSMLESSASAQQWEYFEYVYKEMALSGYKLDMIKYSWLLVEASKAGKWHLLEHAFDTSLESGEIPHWSLFTEMICRALIQQDLERITPLLNSLAHASMRISESQWTSLFQRNNDRFNTDALQGLLTYLHSSNLIMEQPIPDLLRSLESLCGQVVPTKTAILASPQEILIGFSTFQEIDEEDGKDPAFPAECDVVHIHLQQPVNYTMSSSRLGNEGRVDFLLDCRSETAVTDSVLDQLTGDNGNSTTTRVPSATNILQLWKEERS